MTFGGKFPDSAREALRIAGERGHYMVLCTGRTPTQIYPWLPATGLFQGIVAGAGADVRIGSRLIARRLMSREQTDRIIRFCEENGAHVFLQGRDGMYTDRATMEFRRSRFHGDEKKIRERARVFGETTILEDLQSARFIEKAAYYHAPFGAEKIQKILGDDFHVTESSYDMSDHSNGEITMKGVDKAYGMRCFLDAVGLGREDSIAYGDGANDFEMLAYAGIGVAMGNALPELKKAADQVAGKIEEDGIYNSFRDNGLLD